MEQLYRTKDLWEAAALLAHKLPLVDVERTSGICFFVFSDSENAEQKAKEYYFGNLTVNAFGYQEAVARLKKQIFNNK